MSVPTLAASAPRTLTIRGTGYPVLLPSVRDARLHLAAVIFSLHALGQVAFDFRVSIAQILISLATCAVLETAIVFYRERAIMWPASALITGNGVAFILRVQGTRHGDWWSLRGWWIFAATAAVSLLSKHLIRSGGRHIFNPSNFGLVLCFLILGSGRVEPLDFWWGPMSAWMAATLVVIVCGGLAILTRLRLLSIAVAFWLAFAAGVGLLALRGHAMTARWHLGPITGFSFWWILVTSPEILVFLFFMISDPRTTPSSTRGRIAYSVAVGLLAALLIAPAKTEFWSKVAVLGALAIVTAARPLLTRLRLPRLSARQLALAGAAALAVYAGGVVSAGIRAEGTAAAAPLTDTGRLPAISIGPSRGVQTKLREPSARRIAADLVADLRLQAEALAKRDENALRGAAIGDELARLRGAIRLSTREVPSYRLERLLVWLEQGRGQGGAIAVTRIQGSRQLATYTGAKLVRRSASAAFSETLELQQSHGRWLVARSRGERAVSIPRPSTGLQRAAAQSFAGIRLRDVAAQVGLDFRQGAFRFGVSGDAPAMMGGGLCWLDYDNDGWLDLFVVNGYADADAGKWAKRGGLPRSALFRNRHGRFVNVTARSGAGLPIKGQGCAAADLNGDGYTDLFVTTADNDKLLWNDRDGTFTEGARASGVASRGWHSGAAVADLNVDGRPDLFVGGYADARGDVRDLLFVNEGNGPDGHARFREVGRQVGLDRGPYDRSLGAVFTDANTDGRPDLYVANDVGPNRLYLNGASGRFGFSFVEAAERAGVADPNASRGIAAADFSGDLREDLFVTDARGETHAAFRALGISYADERAAFAAALGKSFTGWGDAFVDLNNDGRLDLVLANGAIPVRNLAKDAGPVQALANVEGGFVDVSSLLRVDRLPRTNGRGLAAADFDNDGHVDIAINSVGGKLVLLRGAGGSGHWLEVKLARFAPGAIVTATLPDGSQLVREVHAGSSYLSSDDPRSHFGLGGARRVRELRIWYPNGSTRTIRNIAADRVLAVKP